MGFPRYFPAVLVAFVFGFLVPSTLGDLCRDDSFNIVKKGRTYMQVSVDSFVACNNSDMCSALLDSDPTNEIQTITFNDVTRRLTLSQAGGNVVIPRAPTISPGIVWCIALEGVFPPRNKRDEPAEDEDWFDKRRSSSPYLGELMPVAFTFCPRGWAMAHGQLLPIDLNSALFSLIGTQYGGDGIITFALPDLRDLHPVMPTGHGGY